MDPIIVALARAAGLDKALAAFPDDVKAAAEQALNNAVAQAANPAVIAKEAEQFGMRQDPNLSFINLKNGKIISGKVSKSDAEINVPGYTP